MFRVFSSLVASNFVEVLVQHWLRLGSEVVVYTIFLNNDQHYLQYLSRIKYHLFLTHHQINPVKLQKRIIFPISIKFSLHHTIQEVINIIFSWSNRVVEHTLSSWFLVSIQWWSVQGKFIILRQALWYKGVIFGIPKKKNQNNWNIKI